MLIVYYSKTGNVKRFAEKLAAKGFTCKSIVDNPLIEESFVLITPTHGYGSVPKTVESFLHDNSSRMVAVASSGNKVWGIDLFARSGETIANAYDVPLLHKFQGQGFDSDVNTFIERVLELG